MRKYGWPLSSIVILLVLSFAYGMAYGTPQSSINYMISSDVFSGGGGVIGSSSYKILSSTGQPSPIGKSSSTNYINYAGFWHPILLEVTEAIKGDVNGDGLIDLMDSVLALQVMVGMKPSNVHQRADLNGDDKIGLEEAIFSVQCIARLRGFLAGDYTFVDIGATDEEWFSEFGKYTFYTDGTHTSVFDTNSSAEGLVEGSKDSGTYNLSPEGSFSIFIENGTKKNDGIAKPDSGFILFSNLHNPDEQGLTIGLATAGNDFANADLRGKYHVAFFEREASGTFSAIGTLTFDGSGSYDLYQKYSQSWGTGAGTHTASGTYTVSSDGAVIIHDSGRKGAISADHKTIIIANITDTSEQAVAVGVKAGTTGFSNESLNGSYHCLGFGVNTGGRECYFFTLVFDGVGNFTAGGTMNWSGNDAVQVQSFFGTYSVNDDGSLTVTLDGEITEGAISEDGKLVLFSRIETPEVQDIGIAIKVGDE